MILALALTLLLVLTVTRRALEPACPGCSAKAWTEHSTALECQQCGWSNGAPAQAVVAIPVGEARPNQYELSFQ
jgi:hypothetical protein